MTSKEFNYPAVIYNCEFCGMEFQVSCSSELQDKLKQHKCHKVNKRVERTAEVKQAQVDQFVEDVTADRIHQHKFDKLVQQGMIVNA